MKNLLMLFIILSLLFSGCSNRTPTYHGQTKDDLDFIYKQKKEAIKNKRKSINDYYDLNYECKEYEKHNNIDEANACYIQLNSLKKNIQYYNVVIKNRSEITDELDRQERMIEKERSEAISEFGEDVGEFIEDAFSLAFELLIYAGIAYYAYYMHKLGQEDEFRTNR